MMVMSVNVGTNAKWIGRPEELNRDTACIYTLKLLPWLIAVWWEHLLAARSPVTSIHAKTLRTLTPREFGQSRYKTDLRN